MAAPVDSSSLVSADIPKSTTLFVGPELLTSDTLKFSEMDCPPLETVEFTTASSGFSCVHSKFNENPKKRALGFSQENMLLN